MSVESWYKCLSSAETAGPVLNTFTTAVSCLPTPARHTIHEDAWWIGKRFRVRASGGVSNVVTAQPTFTFEFRLGPTSNIVAFTTGAILCSTTAHTLVPWMLDIEMTCRAVGSGTAANLMGQGIIHSRAFIDAGASADITTLGHTSLLVPETSPAVGTGFDTNVANVTDLFVSCSTSNAGNGITLQQYELLVAE